RIDEQRAYERDRAGADVDDLALDVVRRVAGQVEARDARDGPETHADEPADAGDEQPVEAAQDPDDGEAFAPVPFEPSSLRSGVLEHQRMVPINRSCWGGSASPSLRSRTRRPRPRPAPPRCRRGRRSR